MPWTVCSGERRCSEPSPLVKARAQLPAGHRCCPLLSPASCPRHAPRAPLRVQPGETGRPPTEAVASPRADQPALGEERVGRVLVLGQQPRFGELAVADMAHEHLPGLQGSPLALAASDIDRDRMLVIRYDVVEIDAEGATGELGRLGEVTKDRVHAAVVTREWAAARHMPDGVLIEQLSEGVDVALGEGIEASAGEVLVRVGPGPSKPLEWVASLRLGHPAHNEPPVLTAP